ncbi:MAG TPA: acyl-CoA dehydrogenase family protein [Blastocatellia bacterium]|nr:acyl-CoA dehydrogenase family protein [Blastocatellia bacterium]
MNNGSKFLFTTTSPANTFTREDISKAQQMIGNVAEEFMRREVLPRTEAIYGKDWPVTRALLLTAGELDLLRIDIPEAYGGLGLDKVSSAYVGEQIALLPSFGASLGAHTTIGMLPLVYFGNEAQRAKYLPKLATGEWVAAYCLTEPDSGSDALAAKTKATLSEDGKHYLLNGRKMWITNGGIADVFTIFAKVDGEKFTAFIVERDMGVVSAPEEKKLGLDGSSTTAILLDNVRVPVENVLGEIGKGHIVAFNILNLGRLKLGTRNLGQAKLALNNSINYARDRHQFGRPIASFGLIKRKLAEMAVRCYVGDAMVWRTLGMVDETLESIDQNDTMQVLKAIEQYAVECSIIKVWTSEALGYVVDETVQIYGGYGYSKEFPAEQAYRDARITRIYEGTNEINRTIITTRLLKAAAKGDLPLAETATKLLSQLLNEIPRTKLPGLAYVESQLAVTKNAALLCLQAASLRYGDQINEEQEVLGLLADTLIDVYAIESVWLRTAKMIEARGAEHCAVQLELARVYACDAADRVATNTRLLHATLTDEGSADEFVDALAQLGWLSPINTKAARRTIADTLIEAGRYLW